MNQKSQAFILGVRKTLPYQGGVIPFGLLYATLAINAGFDAWIVILFSMVVFAGSSQLVFIDLYTHLLSSFQAVIGSNIVNARHLIYSAGVSKELSNFSKKWQLILSYLLTDQLFAISAERRQDFEKVPFEIRPWIYFGSGFCTWFFWNVSTAVGIFFGQLIPASWNLSFSIPLMFMPLIFSVSKSKYAYLTCLLAVFLVFALQKLPFGLGVFFAILCAALIGFFVQTQLEKKK